jgi:adenosine deaminase
MEKRAYLLALAAGFSLGLMAAIAPAAADENDEMAARYFESVKSDPAALRDFLFGFPKGGDLHNHLAGAIYPEVILEWAAEDNFCVDGTSWTLQPPADNGCEAAGLMGAGEVQANADTRRQFINAISMRAFVPTANWSGHDQFFSTFIKTGLEFNVARFGDMLARVQNRAGAQNELYLELMKTLNWFEMAEIVANIPQSDRQIDDIPALYKSIMDAGLGAQLDGLVLSTIAQLDAAEARALELMDCDGTAQPGCDVEVRYLYQSIRVGPPALTFAGFILGFRLSEADPRFVGLNLVAPEDDADAIRYYRAHMAMLDFLWQHEGARNISLHAGELSLDLVGPEELRYHIRAAIETGHARRIGHGTAIFYETDMVGLLNYMAAQGIMVEINLTSSDMILGVGGDDHPFDTYRRYGVPLALSTDDEGVARIDLTHEYERAVTSYDLSYGALKAFSRNALGYSFLADHDKARLIGELENRFADFEAKFTE